jgi:hypothetical protein
MSRTDLLRAAIEGRASSSFQSSIRDLLEEQDGLLAPADAPQPDGPFRPDGHQQRRSVSQIHQMQMDVITPCTSRAARSAQRLCLQVGDSGDSTEGTPSGGQKCSYRWISHRIQARQLATASISSGFAGSTHAGSKPESTLNMFKYLLDRNLLMPSAPGTACSAAVAVSLNDLAISTTHYSNALRPHPSPERQWLPQGQGSTSTQAG